MFECSLYGILRRGFDWKGDKFERIEGVYTDGVRKAFLCSETPSNDIYIVFKETPDRNKQRISVACKITKLVVNGGKSMDSGKALLDSLGYRYLSSCLVEGVRYLRNGYQIETTRFKKKEEVVDSSEEEEMDERSREVPPDFLKHYLVKVFVETEDVIEGEQILDNAFQDLHEEIRLVKPNLTVFQD